MRSLNGRDRLLAAAQTLLAENPDREPSTRELYDVSGVAAPTLYHHFGDKDGLLATVVDRAFSAYIERKRSLPDGGDLLSNFAAGWDMHIDFGVENPLLYRLMYRTIGTGHSGAAREAETRLRAALSRLADNGLLTMGVGEAVDFTTAMAIGCVTQLHRVGGSSGHPLAMAMRSSLLRQLTGQDESDGDASAAAKALLARVDPESPLLTPPEHGLLRQWLRVLAQDTGTSLANQNEVTPPSFNDETRRQR